MRLAPIAAAIIAAAIAATGTAHAEPTTDAQKGKRLVQVLRMNGVPVTDPAKTVLMAQTTCFSLRQGQSPGGVVADVAELTGWNNRQASFFYGGATAGFCPEYAPS